MGALVRVDTPILDFGPSLYRKDFDNVRINVTQLKNLVTYYCATQNSSCPRMAESDRHAYEQVRDRMLWMLDAMEHWCSARHHLVLRLHAGCEGMFYETRLQLRSLAAAEPIRLTSEQIAGLPNQLLRYLYHCESLHTRVCALDILHEQDMKSRSLRHRRPR